MCTKTNKYDHWIGDCTHTQNLRMCSCTFCICIFQFTIISFESCISAHSVRRTLLLAACSAHLKPTSARTELPPDRPPLFSESQNHVRYLSHSASTLVHDNSPNFPSAANMFAPPIPFSCGRTHGQCLLVRTPPPCTRNPQIPSGDFFKAR